MQTLAHNLVQQAKKDTKNNFPPSKIRIMIIVELWKNIQISSFMKDQSGAAYFVVPLNIICLGIVDCNSIQDHLHAYIYSEAEGGKVEMRWQY